MFDSERKARRYLESMRFPRGFVCRHCGERRTPWRCKTGLLACVLCREPTRATEGTLFDGSVVPISNWLRLLWHIAANNHGLNESSVRNVLGVAREADASEVVANIRHMMASCTQSMLSGDVQVAVSRVQAGRACPLVAIALGAEGTGQPRVRMRALTKVTARPIQRFVVDHVQAGSSVFTNSWRGFHGLAAAGYEHRRSRLEPTKVSDDLSRVLGLLELWLFSEPDDELDDLQPALDEFAFRYNRRLYPVGLLFYRLMILAVTVEQRRLRRLSEVG